jgi:LmbE family N-acetylglucosaminyl deacetylase
MAGTERTRTALVLSPHPDDELLGCPAHLFALRDAGWRIVNVALSLGSEAEQRERRRQELQEACRRAGFELILVAGEDGPPGIGDELLDARCGATPEQTVRRLVELAHAQGAELLVAPSPHDDHPAHERAGRLALAALRAGAAGRIWLWGLWADVALPNSLCVFDAERLEQIEHALRAHEGELARNDYPGLLRSRARAGAILLPERVFGYGSAGLPADALAEALCALALGDGGELLLLGASTFDGRLGKPPPSGSAIDAAGWLDGPSARAATTPRG